MMGGGAHNEQQRVYVKQEPQKLQALKFEDEEDE